LPRLRPLALAALLIVGLIGAGCAGNFRVPAGTGRAEGLAAVARGYGPAAFRRLTADMSPSMLALARRNDGLPSKDYWGRVPGWETYALGRTPVLGVGLLTAEEARLINALKAGALEPPPPARPFILPALGEDRAAAIRCMTQAVYYEAATEPLEGRQAVAQTVLNRVRHPGYPKSVCGVVYQGSLRTTGCQFSFTCDGSLSRSPSPVLWAQAEQVARQALDGFVLRSVGTATHYHADYVAPYWAPTLFRITQLGRHIFYRWTGPWGLPPAFTGRYAGGEASLSQAVLEGLDARTQGAQMALIDDLSLRGLSTQATRTVVLSLEGVSQTYTVIVPGVPGQESLRAPGALKPPRRAPTPEEVAEINARLKALEDAQTPSRSGAQGVEQEPSPPSP